MKRAYFDGMDRMKELMMKDAVDGYIREETIGHGSMALGVSLQLYVLEKMRFKRGDKVKVIILKKRKV